MKKKSDLFEKEWETAKYMNVCWPMLLKCNTTAVKVRSLLLFWSLKCQRQSSRPPITWLGSCRRGSLTFRNSSLALLPPAACSHLLRLLSLLPSYASPGGAVCVTQMMCVRVLREFWRHFGGTLEELMFGFCLRLLFSPKTMNSWDLVVRRPSFFMSLLMLIVTAVGLATGGITLHSLKESNRSIWDAVPNHLPSSLSSSSHPPRSTWRVNWLWNCRFLPKTSKSL